MKKEERAVECGSLDASPVAKQNSGQVCVPIFRVFCDHLSQCNRQRLIETLSQPIRLMVLCTGKAMVNVATIQQVLEGTLQFSALVRHNLCHIAMAADHIFPEKVCYCLRLFVWDCSGFSVLSQVVY